MTISLTRRLLFAATIVCLAWSNIVSAQRVVISQGVGGGGFEGFSAAPISRTAVLQSYMQAVDSGAVLGFALAIRGPVDWYNQRTSFGEIAADSLPSGIVGQWWEVGPYRYRILYDQRRKSLSLFGTSVDLTDSRVVLVTLSTDPEAAAIVRTGKAVDLYMAEPDSFSDRFLPKAAEVRAFAGMP
jgi:hypothetical protein